MTGTSEGHRSKPVSLDGHDFPCSTEEPAPTPQNTDHPQDPSITRSRYQPFGSVVL
jgi:hypothetical protein